MDTILHLPFPHEVCSKIFMFACKSPHTGLVVEVLKKKLHTMKLNIPKNDDDVIQFRSYEMKNYPSYIPIDIDLFTCFHNLIFIGLSNTRVSGDIAHLKWLPNLTGVGFRSTCVTGDISHLKSLQKLSHIYFSNTCVSGDIAVLKSLPNLIDIYLENTRVYGDIENLKSLLNLNEISLFRTDISGDIENLKSRKF